MRVDSPRDHKRRTKKIYQRGGGSSIVVDPRIMAGTTPGRTQGRTQGKTRRKYHRDDYHSNNGMMTAIWGPPTWHMLHCISFNYPVEPTATEKRRYRAFVLNLRHVLPCGKCRKNLVKNFARLPLEQKHMASRDTFSRYIYDLHEVVNTMLGKKSGLTYQDVRDTYENFRARCSTGATTGGVASETGCVIPYNGRKQKCVLEIRPA